MKTRYLLLVGMLAACGKHPGTYTTGEVTKAGAPVDTLESKADAMWAERIEEEKLTKALEAYASIVASDPANRHALEMLTRGWYLYGDSYTTDKLVQVERWGKAIEFGTQCLSLNSEFKARILAGDKEKVAVESATKDDVPCLYWTASALGKWGKAQSLSKTLKHLPTVKAYISKVEELEPQYWYFGPARYWGAYYSALPSFAGQDFEMSAQKFATSVEGSPEYLGTYVLRAEFLSVPTNDIAQFDADIAKVLGADPTAVPEITAENTREQEKAQRLKDMRHELFPKKVLEAADAGAN